MTPPVSPEPRVVRYDAAFRDAFSTLNLDWIQRYFTVEPRDSAVLADPEGTVLAPGGEVFFLLEGDQPVGTCAMIPVARDAYYLTKMAVAPQAQGRGHGERLLAAALAWARARGGTRVELTSNRKLTPALALYRKHGFREVPLVPDDAAYARVDIRMTLDL